MKQIAHHTNWITQGLSNNELMCRILGMDNLKPTKTQSL